MSNEASSIKTTFKNLITVYEETGSLLEDAGSLLEKYGYHCTHGNVLGTEQSKIFNTPKWWITPYCVRYFLGEENPTERKAVGVFFVDIGFKPINPIVLIGCFKMKHNEDGEQESLWYWFLKEAWWTLVTERRMDEELEFEGKWSFTSGKIRAIPLEKVKDLKTLEQYVITPLIEMSC